MRLVRHAQNGIQLLGPRDSRGQKVGSKQWFDVMIEITAAICPNSADQSLYHHCEERICISRRWRAKETNVNQKQSVRATLGLMQPE
jgi:hypothetical protein